MKAGNSVMAKSGSRHCCEVQDGGLVGVTDGTHSDVDTKVLDETHTSTIASDTMSTTTDVSSESKSLPSMLRKPYTGTAIPSLVLLPTAIPESSRTLCGHQCPDARTLSQPAGVGLG